MDPSIMKLLEEDEDESMHSGADVEAFQAALNRDIGGDASTSQPSDSDNAALSQGSNHTSSQSLPQWQNASQDQSSESQIEQDQRSAQQQEQTLSGMELKQHGSVIESQQQNTVPEELKHLQMPQKKSQDDCQQGKGHPTSLQNPQTTEMQISEKIRTPIDEPDRRPSLEGESQYAKLQKMSNQQATITEQASNPINRTKPGQVPFGVLLPVLQAQLDKDRAMQLQTIFAKLKKNEIPKEGFVRLMRGIVGDHMLKLAVMKIQSQPSSNQFQLQSQASARQNPQRMPSVSASSTQFSDPHSFAQLHQKGTDSSADPSHTAVVQMPADSSYPTIENDAQKTREVNRQSDSHGIQVSQVSSSSESTVNQEREQSSVTIQGLNKQQQQHLHFPPIYGSTGGNYHPYSGTNVNTSTSSVKPQPHDTQLRQISQHQNLSSTQLGGTTQGMNMMSLPKFERHNSINDPKRVQAGSVSHLANNSTPQQNSVPWQSSSNKEQYSAPSSSMAGVKQEAIDQATEQQHKPHFSHPQGLSCFSSAQLVQGNATPGIVKDETLEKQSSRMGLSTSTSMIPSNLVSPSMTTQLDPNVPLGSRIPSTASPSVTNARTTSKKPSIGQKKPLEALGSSPTLPSKKQKVSGAFSDQSIEQLNDVTAVSGVNLREEEEQLFSGPKEDSRVSEASRRVVQEEEERLILQKTPLQKKLAEIMTKCGLKSISNDVERCLSLCVEERMRGLISNLIRLSRQRVDIEKPRHRTLITLDVRQQIMTMNRKAREEWEKKQAEAERLRRLNEPEGNNGVEGEKEKDEGRAKSLKANKEEDDKMRTTAANVAARAAVGGDDMLSKWQLMAEQARQKREGGVDASGSQPGKDVSRRLTSGRKDNQDVEKKGNAASGAVRKVGRNQVIVPQTKVARKISIKDVIAVLEREPQMSRSTLIYRLYERIHSDATVE
ncbi:transcription initiation factor TFIID subunit 4b-like isoform X2 [Corylus avellana]|uniref:transcription initiation factor TFIID subunit 4b-like isoform X2 n=1 Tax=Corylus avellana TaxID=13451 RepID=UPI001E207260|nr:transcription initiation factor TFIID subunit 4b-like isoform X2 [Corylus avellana]